MKIRVRRKHLFFSLLGLLGISFLSWESYQLSPVVRLLYLRTANGVGYLDPAVRLIEDDDSEVRMAAMEVVTKRGTEAIPALARGLNHRDSKRRSMSAHLLGRLGPSAAETLPALKEMMRTDENNDVRISAAKAVGLIGKDDREQMAEMLALLADGEEKNRIVAVQAIFPLVPADLAGPALIRALGDESEKVREEAAESVGKYGRSAKSAIPALVKALMDSSREVREEADEALQRIRGGLLKEKDVEELRQLEAALLEYKQNRNSKR